MSYTAPNRLLMPARHSIDTLTDSWLVSDDASSMGALWPSANLAIYVPLRIPRTVTVVKLWYSNNTVSSVGNVDMGLYDATGNAVVSATAAAKSTTAGEISFDVTDTVVPAGCYYIALAATSAADYFYAFTPAAPIATAFGIRTEASAYPLPTTATFAVSQTLAYYPIIGLLLEGTAA